MALSYKLLKEENGGPENAAIMHDNMHARD